MMKFFRAILLMSVVTLLAACGGGGGSAGNTSGVALFSTAADQVTIFPGASQTYTIGGGIPGYSATSSSGAASVSVNGKTLIISGANGGRSTVTITDAAGAKVFINVTVGTNADLFITAPEKLTLGIGNSSSIFFAGGGSGSYIVSSGNMQVATVTQTDNQFYFRGVSTGVATMVIADSSGGRKTVEVTVGSGVSLYSTAPAAVTVSVGASSAVYSIGGGSQVYSVSSSDQSVATVGQTSKNEFVITGKTGGKAVVTIKDTQGALVKIDIVVGTNDALFSTAASDISIAVGGTASYKVGGGTTLYSVGSSDESIAKATIVGNDLTILGLAPGKATIIVKDSTNGSLTITANVGSTTVIPLFTTSGADIVLLPNTTPTFTIGGGRAPYSASSTNKSVVDPSVAGTTLSIKGVAAGSAKVLVTDAVGAQVTINATIAASVVTPLFTTSPSAVTIATGVTPPAYTIGGGTAPYTVTSSNISVVAPALAGTSFTLPGGTPGTAQVVVRDAVGASVNVDVTVTAAASTPLDILPGDSTAAVGDTLTFRVTGGTAPFTLTNNNSSIASVTPATVNTTNGTFTAKLLNVGATVLSVTDAQSQVKKITLTATAAGSTLRLSPSVITVGEDSTGDVTLMIYGGTGPYRAFTSDLNLSSVPAGDITQAANGTAVIVGLGTNASRCVVVKDSSGTIILGGSYVITITIVDSLGASATTTFNIKDNFKGGLGCL